MIIISNLRNRVDKYKKQNPEWERLSELTSAIIESEMIKMFGYLLGIYPTYEEIEEIKKREILIRPEELKIIGEYIEKEREKEVALIKKEREEDKKLLKKSRVKR